MYIYFLIIKLTFRVLIFQINVQCTSNLKAFKRICITLIILY